MTPVTKNWPIRHSRADKNRRPAYQKFDNENIFRNATSDAHTLDLNVTTLEMDGGAIGLIQAIYDSLFKNRALPCCRFQSHLVAGGRWRSTTLP